MIDQIGNKVSLLHPPQRIISTVPSITELLFYLGLEDRIVGRTSFCIHPNPEIKEVPKIGGTKRLRIDAVKALQPDLVIANKEENVKEQIEGIQAFVPTYISDIKTIEDALKMIADVGKLCGVTSASEELLDRIQSTMPKRVSLKKALYLIWRDPFMSIGGDTFISDMMPYAGYENIIKEQKRYPSLSAKQIKDLAPEVILLSSEPYPFKEKHIQELQSLCPQATIKLVDGELYSWYGNKILKAFEVFSVN